MAPNYFKPRSWMVTESSVGTCRNCFKWFCSQWYDATIVLETNSSKSPKGQGSKEGKHNGCKVDCFTHGIPICKTKPLLPSKMSWVPSTKVLNHALINWGYLDGLLRRRPDEPAKSVGSKCFVKVGPMGQSWRPNIASYIDRHGGTVLATGFAWILDIATDCDCRPTHVKMIQESFKKVSRCHDSSWPWH